MIGIEDTMLGLKVALKKRYLEAWHVILLGEGGGAIRSKKIKWTMP